MAMARDWQRKFIDNLRETGNISKACIVAKISRPTAYAERERNAVFAQEWEDALEHIADDLEDVARQRAVDGSDVLLIFLLKGLKPDKYRENKRVEVAGDKEAPLQIEIKPANYREALSALMPDDSDS